MRRSAGEINSEASSGPPEGVPAKGFLLLIDPDEGQGLANPPGEGLGKRVAVETYEVAIDARL
jgi:hypothetical protein